MIVCNEINNLQSQDVIKLNFNELLIILIDLCFLINISYKVVNAVSFEDNRAII